MDGSFMVCLTHTMRWSHAQSSGAPGTTQVSVVNLKCDVLRCCANVVHCHPRAQDECGRHGVVEWVMNQCHLEEKNPYLKEWAILCLRNLCENHEVRTCIPIH